MMMESYGVAVSGSQLDADCINTMKAQAHAHPTRVHVWRYTVISRNKKRASDHVVSSESSSSTSSLFFFSREGEEIL